MKVLAYPVETPADVSKLPIFYTDRGEKAVRLAPYEGLHEACVIANRDGCQWLVFKDKPIVRDEREWIALT